MHYPLVILWAVPGTFAPVKRAWLHIDGRWRRPKAVHVTYTHTADPPPWLWLGRCPHEHNRTTTFAITWAHGATSVFATTGEVAFYATRRDNQLITANVRAVPSS